MGSSKDTHQGCSQQQLEKIPQESTEVVALNTAGR
jgi:hypothetical protein